MKNIFITIQYDGSRYSGWQRQGNTDNTIENKISSVLKVMLGNDDDIEIHGSGRTDAGVHALAQTANFKICTDKTPDEIMTYLNKYLPEDIKVTCAKEVEMRFHARLCAVGKTYIYNIDNSSKANVFLRKYTEHIEKPLNLDKMKQASKLFVGTHDFFGFCDMKSKKKSSVRTINCINFSVNNQIISIEFDGNGFLYHMVRRICAALIEIGLENMEIEDLYEYFTENNSRKFEFLAPAKGLTLKEVRYT